MKKVLCIFTLSVAATLCAHAQNASASLYLPKTQTVLNTKVDTAGYNTNRLLKSNTQFQSKLSNPNANRYAVIIKPEYNVTFYSTMPVASHKNNLCDSKAVAKLSAMPNPAYKMPVLRIDIVDPTKTPNMKP